MTRRYQGPQSKMRAAQSLCMSRRWLMGRALCGPLAQPNVPANPAGVDSWRLSNIAVSHIRSVGVLYKGTFILQPFFNLRNGMYLCKDFVVSELYKYTITCIKNRVQWWTYLIKGYLPVNRWMNLRLRWQRYVMKYEWYLTLV